ncbi:MAG: sugar-binding transcriptional regulator [Treponema sp.]|jgi:DNA-binding transcriptional regulator LsrR (DeoR family)|nr:sugar-binding transcriptional regulator [Treponema sp.]
MNKSFDFLVEVAKHYYVDSMSQSEIAELYKLSRPTVANILKECREKGIVEIRINDLSPFSTETGKLLADRFGLRSVCVVSNEADYTLTLYKTCQEAAAFLASSVFCDGMRIGISWGTGLYHTIRQLPKCGYMNCEVVQLMGGLGASALYYDGSELAHILANKISARYYPVLSPVLVKTKELKDALLSEPGIRESMEKSKTLDLALVGLSPDKPEDSSLVKAGFLTIEEAQQLADAGAFGHLCGYHYDAEGRFMDIPTNDRVVGVNVGDYLRIERRIGVACGKQKSRAIYSALKGKLITDLITDELTALQIISFTS